MFRMKLSAELELDGTVDAEIIARALLETVVRKGIVELAIKIEDTRYDERDEEE